MSIVPGVHLRYLLPLLLVLTTLAYLPGLPGPFVLDDRNNLAPLAAIDEGTLSPWDFIIARSDGALFRPVSNASFVANWWLSGDNISSFKAVNLLIHLLCGLVVFFLTRALLRIAFAQHASQSIDAGALFACAMWLLAPLLVSTVLYTVQRMAQLSALFTLLGLLCYVHGRQRQSSLLIVLALAVMWPLGVLSKENGALLPLFAALIEWWWLCGADHNNAHAQRWRVLLIACVSASALALFAKLLSDPQWLLASYQGRDFTMGERLVTQPAVLLDYLGNLLLVPGSSAMSVFRDDYTAAKTLWASPGTWLSILFWVVALGAGVVYRHRSPLVHALGFAVLFFVCAHLVESSIFALELYFEHRNYLPAFGVFFALASCGLWMIAHVRAPIIGGLAVVLVLGCALLTAQRTLRWGDEASLYTHATRTHPHSARAWLGLASVQFSTDQFDSALISLANSARILGPNAQAAIALQGIAAHCVSNRTVPESLWRQLREAPILGSDLFTTNALAWMAGAFHAGTCSATVRSNVQQLLASLPIVPSSWNPGVQKLRDTHLQRLMTAR